MIPEIIMSLLAERSLYAGGPVLSTAKWQFLIPLLPPGMIADFNLTPPRGAYAAMKYSFTMSSDIVPGSIYASAGQGGTKDVIGYIMPDWQSPAPENGYYIVFTAASPIVVQIINDSNVNQTFSGTQNNVVMPSEESFFTFIEFVKDYGRRAQATVARECNILLEQLVIAAGQIPATKNKGGV